jgi:enamine deaminase RidA (YjgF/YER057c/UK114 family)
MFEKFTSGSVFEEMASFSRVVKAGNTIYVSGCTGYDYIANTIKESIEAQCEQTFQNIIQALAKTGATLQNVVRCNYIFTEGKDFETCFPIIKKYLADVKPASTVICAQFPNPKVKIEIEVTAVL